MLNLGNSEMDDILVEDQSKNHMGDNSITDLNAEIKVGLILQLDKNIYWSNWLFV